MNYKQFPILFVDDEMSNLQALRELLEDEFSVDTAESGQEALKKLSEKEYVILLSDQKMEPMDGVELLSRARDKYPGMLRILITGYADYQASVDAINEAQVYQYIFKSPDVINHEIGSFLKRAMDYYWEREERIRLQNLMMRENRLASLGRLAWSLSHEMNNPLVSLQTFIQLLPTKYQDPEFRDTFCKLMQEDIERIRTMVKRVTKFTDAEMIEKGDALLHDIVEEAIELFKKSPEAEKVKLEKSPVPLNLVVNVNQYQIVQVLLNLFTNSAQAMKEDCGGKVEIQTGRDPITLKDREGKEEQYVRLIIQDNGPGIEKKILENIFDPFLTTHNTGNRNRQPGLGLFISHMIIEGHGGYIGVQSKVGLGTTVAVDLPVNST